MYLTPALPATIREDYRLVSMVISCVDQNGILTSAHVFEVPERPPSAILNQTALCRLDRLVDSRTLNNEVCSGDAIPKPPTLCRVDNSDTQHRGSVPCM